METFSPPLTQAFMQEAVYAMSLYLYSLEQDGISAPTPNMDVAAESGEIVVPITAWLGVHHP